MSTQTVWGPAFSTRDNPFAPRVVHVLQAQVLDIGCPNTPWGEPVVGTITFKMETLAENVHQVSLLFFNLFQQAHNYFAFVYIRVCFFLRNTVLGKSLVYFDFSCRTWQRLMSSQSITGRVYSNTLVSFLSPFLGLGIVFLRTMHSWKPQVSFQPKLLADVHCRMVPPRAAFPRHYHLASKNTTRHLPGFSVTFLHDPFISLDIFFAMSLFVSLRLLSLFLDITPLHWNTLCHTFLEIFDLFLGRSRMETS